MDTLYQARKAGIESDKWAWRLVRRYKTGTATVPAPAGHGAAATGPTGVDPVDGLPPGEGMFLACPFWLVDNYVLMGRRDDAERLFEQLVDLGNDVGLLAEEYDPVSKRQLGNFPQAFSHLSVVNTAYNLTRGREAPVEHRRT